MTSNLVQRAGDVASAPTLKDTLFAHFSVTNDSPKRPTDCQFSAASAIAAPHVPCYTESTMKTRVRVLLCGDTLLMAGLRASLAAASDVEVLAATEFSLYGQLPGAQRPDVVIADDAAFHPGLLCQLNTLSPNVLLISVAIDMNHVIVWSAQQFAPASTRELVEFIVQHSLARLCAAHPSES